MAHMRAFYQRHYWFLVVLFLFVSFRLLAILLFRPGGYIYDYADYAFYYAWGTLLPMGHRPFVDLWAAYPPLFPALMLPVFEVASRVPAWVDPRLVFYTLFGVELLLFETGNLILIYRLAGKLDRDGARGAKGEGQGQSLDSRSTQHATQLTPHPSPLAPPIFYALLFAPVYILLGWFETMPLFFLLLGLDLLLGRNRWGWMGSAVAAALGFLVKLTPVLLLPVAVRWMGCRLSWAAARQEWFRRRSPGNLFWPVLYLGVFAIVTLGLGYALAGANPPLAWSSLRINAIRAPWQSIWALLEGNYGFGLVPLDMRNLPAYYAGGEWGSTLPWGGITLLFGALYLWLYTRRYDWTRLHTPVAFTGISVLWLLLYSKGWSPQFLVWILAFLALLTPTLRGAAIAIAFTFLNFLESHVFLVILPDEHWIMVVTVLVRTSLMVVLAVEWLGQIWPAGVGARRLQQAGAWGSAAMLAVVVLATLLGAPRAAQAYTDRRWAEHPCREAVALLKERAGEPAATVATAEFEVWRDFYPWLRNDYDLRVLDGYDPHDRPAAAVIGEKMAAVAATGEFWWVESSSTGNGQQWSDAAAQFFADPKVHVFDEQTLGACHLARVQQLAEGVSLAEAATAGGPIQLRSATLGPGKVGAPLHVVLYWQADSPVAASYTVFTQLFDPSGVMVAQQDNLPVNGLAPTNTWQPGRVVRDAYQLAVPAGAPAGAYQLQIGLYDGDGRRMLILRDGTTTDHLTIPVHVQ